jgi:hypothetical protein
LRISCRHDERQSNQPEYVDYQNPHKKEQRNSAKQQMTDIVLPIFVAMCQCVIRDKAGYQQKYPVDHRLRLWCAGPIEPGYRSGRFILAEKLGFHPATPLWAF